MTWKELKRFISDNIANSDSNTEERNKEIKLQRERFAVFRDKPFWISDVKEHKKADIASKGACCFNHIIGLPTKDGIEKPIFDYEMNLVHALDNNKSIFVKKARGLGITELLLRYMASLCVKDNTYNNCRFHIVTGPRIQLAEDLIDRLYNLFMNKLNINCKQVGPIITVNGVTIQAFPSHTSFTMRGYTNVKFIFIDEAAYFPPGQQDEVKAVSEGYRVKSDPHIVIVSTPNKPGDFFEAIDRDRNSIFAKLNFHYTLGLGKIYNPAEIEKEKIQPYFKREFELHYAVGTGNVFIESTLQRAEELGIQYRYTPYNADTPKSLGIDPGFGSSKTAFTVVELVDGIIHVLYTKQFANSSTSQMADHAKELMIQYGFLQNNGDDSNKVWIDGSQPGFIRSLKYQLPGEVKDYERLIEKTKQDGNLDKLYLYMRVVPVNFSTHNKQMLGNLKKYIDMGRVAIDPEEHKELLTELRIATTNEDMVLEKNQTNTMDLLDSLRLACLFVR